MKNIDLRRNKLKQEFSVWKEMTLYQRLVEAEKKYSRDIFFVSAGIEYTYSEILNAVGNVAKSLTAAGVSLGDCVACVLSNRVEFVYITFALAKIGAVKVPINRNASLTEVLYVLKKTKSKFFITERDQDMNIGGEEMSVLKVIDVNSRFKKSEKIIPWNDFMKAGEIITEEPLCLNPFAISDIIFTSGSTGAPKGVMLSHDMLLRSAFANCLNRGFEKGRKILVPLPLFHVYGYVEGLIAVLFVGGSIFAMQGKFDPEAALEIIDQFSVQDILCVPSIMMKILQFENLQNYSLSSLYAAYCSASVCPEWVWTEIKSKLKIKELITGYGMTEVSGASVQTDPDDDVSILLEKVGKILEGFSEDNVHLGPVISYKVVDPITHALKEKGQAGELICKGTIVTKSYCEGSHKEDNFTEDGWLKTGDLGFFDEEGYLRYIGRCNDLYKVNGENVSPQFVDKVISECEHVVVVETVGIPDEKLGWIGVAFIEAVSEKEVCKEKIIEYCRQNLAPYQVPKYYFFSSSKKWPQTSTGKVQKSKLREFAKKMLEESNCEVRCANEHFSVYKTSTKYDGNKN